jgi:hypothetical protein
MSQYGLAINHGNPVLVVQACIVPVIHKFGQIEIPPVKGQNVHGLILFTLIYQYHVLPSVTPGHAHDKRIAELPGNGPADDVLGGPGPKTHGPGHDRAGDSLQKVRNAVAGGQHHPVRSIDDRAWQLLTQLRAAFQGAAMRIGIGNLVEYHGRDPVETDGSLSHSPSEKHKVCGYAVLERQFSKNRAIAVHQVGGISMIVKLKSNCGKIVNPANE